VGRVKRQIRPEELVQMVVPIYDKHFSHEDVKELIKFYQRAHNRIGAAAIEMKPVPFVASNRPPSA